MKERKNYNVTLYIIFITMIAIFSFLTIINNNDFEFKKTSILTSTKDLIKSDTNNLNGNFYVKSDKKTYLKLMEDGSYELSLNVCDKYLNIKGNFEKTDKKVKLINSIVDSKYNTLNDNKELYFTIINKRTLSLDEDLECVYQETIFKSNIESVKNFV